MSRCRDDFWMWAAFAVAASAADAQSCSCACRALSDEREPTSEELAARAQRDRVEAAARRRRYLGVLAWFLVVGALVAWAINSEATRTRAGFQPEEDIQPIPVVAVTTDVSPPPPPSVAETESVAEPVIMPASLGVEPMPPLPSENLFDQTAVWSVAPPTQEPIPLDVTVFRVGSSRDEVMAAQGGPPTYAAHHDRTVWWGSSRVEFDRDGRVQSWVDGTPPLNVSPR